MMAKAECCHKFRRLHPIDFFPVSQKDSANVSLKISGAQKVSPNKLLRTEN